MVRAAVAFAVFALGAASALAQSAEPELDLATRELISEVEARDYIDEVDAREFVEEYANVDARDNEVFGGLDAREAEEVFEYIRDVSKNKPAPSKTVTVTHTTLTKPTSCNYKQLKKMEKDNKLSNARKTLLDAHKKKPTSLKEKMRVRKAKQVLIRNMKKQAREKRAKARKAQKEARLAKLRAAKLRSAKGPAATGKASKTTAKPSKITKAPTDPKKKKDAKKQKVVKKVKVLKGSKNVGKDGVTTVHITTTAANPSCSASTSFLRSLRKVKRDVDEELESVFQRETEFDELD